MNPTMPLWRRLLTPPVFDDEDKTRNGRTLHTILLTMFVATLAAYASLIFDYGLIRLIAISSIIIIEVVSFALLHSGRIKLAALVFCIVSWLVLVVALVFTGGVGGAALPVQVLIVLIAGLILGGASGLIFAGLSSLAGLGMMLAALNGVLPPSMIENNPTSYWVFIVLTFLSSAGLIYLTTNSLKEAIERARHNAAAQAAANKELQAIRASLEDQVTERTKALEQRSRYLQATIEVGRAAASILDTEQLIQQTVDLIQEQFQLYYAGLFLVDADGEWAIHKAGTGQAGRALLRRGHRIRVGTGMIGWSIANAAPRIAQIAADDAQRLATTELPETRSEAAIPLRSRGKIIGAITVQSNKPDAFGEVEIISFQSMADQVAIAIENARLLEESQRAVQEVQRAYGVASHMAWKDILQTSQRIAYRFEKGTVREVDEPITTPQKPTTQEPEAAPLPGVAPTPASLHIPIKVREQVIGYLNLRRTLAAGNRTGEGDEGDDGSTQSVAPFNAEQIELLQGLSDQLGAALEGARLYQDSQRLALREQLTSEVTSRIRETLDMDTVLKTAVQEIQQTLDVPEVVITLKGETQANLPPESTPLSEIDLSPTNPGDEA